MGIDDRGREILSFLPGTVATYPRAPHVLTDETLVAVATLLRAYHDATEDFVPPADAQWQWEPHTPQEVLCHKDFAPYNLVFDGDELIGVIDFDTASPGPRVWDMAYTAYRFVPLTDPANPDVRNPGLAEQNRRLELFVDSYGDKTIDSAIVAETAIDRLRELVELIATRARAGDPAQRAVLDRGDTAIYERDISYIEASGFTDN